MNRKFDISSSVCIRRVDELTSRQVEVLEGLASGAPRKQVADDLGISENTLRAHVQVIYARLGIHTEVEAVRVAVCAKLV